MGNSNKKQKIDSEAKQIKQTEDYNEFYSCFLILIDDKNDYRIKDILDHYLSIINYIDENPENEKMIRHKILVQKIITNIYISILKNKIELFERIKSDKHKLEKLKYIIEDDIKAFTMYQLNNFIFSESFARLLNEINHVLSDY